jgi:hypothetical protein
MKLLFLTTAIISNAEALWDFGMWCPDVPKMEDFDYDKFKGVWHEIYRDWGHDAISEQQCTTSEYSYSRLGSQVMRRTWEKSKWNLGFWNWITNIGDSWTWEKIYTPWIFHRDVEYIQHWPWYMNIFDLPIFWGFR